MKSSSLSKKKTPWHIYTMFMFFCVINIVILGVGSVLFISPKVNKLRTSIEHNRNNELISKLYNVIDNYLDDRLLLLKQLSSNSLILASLMNNEANDVRLINLIQNYTLIGEKVKINVLNILAEPLYSNHRFHLSFNTKKAIAKALDQSEISFLLTSNNKALFIIPIKYGVTTEGVLVADITSGLNDYLHDLIKSNELIIRLEQKDHVLASTTNSFASVITLTKRNYKYDYTLDLDINTASLQSEEDNFLKQLIIAILFSVVSSILISFIFLFKQLIRPYAELENKEQAVLTALEGIAELDSENKIIYRNDSFNNVMTMSKHDGKDCFLSYFDTQEKRTLNTAFQKGNTLAVKTHFGTKKNETIYIKVKIHNKKNGQKYIFIENITSETHLSNEKENLINSLRDKNTQLEQANVYKSEFLANMSHELRTPLNSIILLSNILKDEGEDQFDKDALETLGYINRGGQTLLSLINDILDLAKVEAGKMDIIKHEVELATLLSNLKQEFKLSCESKSLEFRLSMDEDLPDTIVSDQKRLMQIIRNFLSNAVKFTETGHISFSIKRSLDQTSQEETIEFSVSDSGIGLTQEQQTLIFDSFKQIDSTLNRKYQGTGLGLTISTNLAKLLGGKVLVSSEIEKGSTFKLILPLNREHVGAVSVEVPLFRQTDQTLEQTTHTQILCIGEPEALPNEIQRRFRIDYTVTEEEFFNKLAATHYHYIIIKPYCKHKDLIQKLPSLCMNGTAHIIICSYDYLTDYDRNIIFEYSTTLPLSMIYTHNENDSLMRKVLQNILSINDYDKTSEAAEKYTEDKKILIVDDDDNNIFSLSNLLRSYKIETISASAGQQAIDILHAENDIDIVLMDIMMPEMDGNETTRLIRECDSYKNLPIIAVTAKAMSSDRVDCLLAGANDFVTKPIDNDKLIKALLLHLK